MTGSDFAELPPFVILGATGAVGQELARRLHARGAKLRLIARDADKLSALQAELGAAAAGSADSIETTLLEASDPASIQAAVLEANQAGPCSGIAHCIGSLLLKPARSTSFEEWHEVLETNLSSAFAVTTAAPKVMKQGGSVVFCSSVAASLGLANHEAIAAAKAGLVGLARAASASNVRRNLRFHCVAPALVDSQMTESLLSREGMREAAAKQNPLGRIGTPKDVANAILFLLDPDNDWIDAQVLGVDGGYGVLRPL
ncbi:MAG: SDR family NAD(P)-dependent oxidoreductase [Planctomycetota bacterium]